MTEIQKLNNLEIFFLRVKEITEQRSIWQFNNLKLLKNLDVEINHSTHSLFQFLNQYSQLETLTLSGTTPDLKAVGKVVTLKNLHLWNLSNSCTLEALNELRLLENISLTLGGRETLNELQNSHIRVLRINQIKGLKKLPDLSKLTSLEWLDLVDLPQLDELVFPEMLRLKKLSIFNCKSIQQIESISKLKKLKWLFIDRTPIDFDKFMQTKFPLSLKYFDFFTDKVRRDKEIANQLKTWGYKSVMKSSK